MHSLIAAALVVVSAVAFGAASSNAAELGDQWMSKIRRDHPRLFFNKDTWPLVKARADDVFLHLIQVGDRSLAGMTEAKLLEADGAVGVSFQADDRSVSVLFGAVGGPSGHIRIAARGANLTDKELARSVMPQAGIGSPENPL
jgi:hypothetical protein